MRPTPSRHVAELREALEHALDEASSDRERDATIEAIQEVLSRSASRQGEVDEDGRRTASVFLDRLLVHLTPIA